WIASSSEPFWGSCSSPRGSSSTSATPFCACSGRPSSTSSPPISRATWISRSFSRGSHRRGGSGHSRPRSLHHPPPLRRRARRPPARRGRGRGCA
ncbi:MAG: hypothetical protein AVDCRST_MAG45-1469, partial [uncultured Solirubrobacterales bacterium]